MTKRVCFDESNLSEVVIVERQCVKPSHRCMFWYTLGEIRQLRRESQIDTEDLLQRRRRVVSTVLNRQKQHLSKSRSGSVLTSSDNGDDGDAPLSETCGMELAKFCEAHTRADRSRARRQGIDIAESLGVDPCCWRGRGRRPCATSLGSSSSVSSTAILGAMKEWVTQRIPSTGRKVVHVMKDWTAHNSLVVRNTMQQVP